MAPTVSSSGSLTSAQLLIEETSALLGQLGSFIRELDPEVFRGLDSLGRGSLGAHARHLMDHVSALVDAAPLSPAGVCVVNYQDRVRGTEAEVCPQSAAQRVAVLQRKVQEMLQIGDGPALEVRQLAGPEGALGELRLSTSWEREWAFVYSHALHHMALMALLAHERGVPVPPEFGVAPSTLRERQRDSSKS